MNLEDEVSKRNDSNKKSIDKILNQVFGEFENLDNLERENLLDKLVNYIVECKYATNYAKAIFNRGRKKLGVENPKNRKIWLRRLKDKTIKNVNYISASNCEKINDYCKNLLIQNKDHVFKLKNDIKDENMTLEIKKFFSRYYFSLAFMLGYRTGMRMCDVILIKRQELERLSDKLIIYQKKTGNPNLVAWLGDEEELAFLLNYWPSNTDDTLEKYLQRSFFYDSFEEIYKAATNSSKPKGLGPHSLRYKTATSLYLDSARIQLGHTSNKTTLGYINSELENLTK